MDWIEFVSKHSGSPFSPKMRHQNITGKEIVDRIEETTGTLINWIRATEKQLTLQQALRVKQINTALATVAER